MMARSTARRAQAPHFEVNIFTGDAHRLSPKFVDNVLVVSGAAPLAEYLNRVGRGVTPVQARWCGRLTCCPAGAYTVRTRPSHA